LVLLQRNLLLLVTSNKSVKRLLLTADFQNQLTNLWLYISFDK